MSLSVFLTHLLFGAGMLAVAVASTYIMLRWGRIIDHPGHRSSHDSPTPKSGGIAILFTFLLGILAIRLLGDATQIERPYFWGFFLGATLVALMSLYDDVTHQGYTVKLLTHVVAGGALLAFGVVLDRLSFPWLGEQELGWAGFALTLLWVVGLTNAYNFMDGLDGLAAGVALITSISFGIITYSQGSQFSYIVCYALAAGALGFLIFNFPPARIFMGDVGSAFLGFVFAALAIIAARYDHSHTSFLVMPLLLFNFIFDTALTLVRRALRGEPVFHAHRDHLYQLFNQLGYSHRSVSLFHYGVCVAQGYGAWWMVHEQGEIRLSAYVPFILWQAAYAFVILRRAKARGLLD